MEKGCEDLYTAALGVASTQPTLLCACCSISRLDSPEGLGELQHTKGCTEMEEIHSMPLLMLNFAGRGGQT